jgi:hypothetical protein
LIKYLYITEDTIIQSNTPPTRDDLWKIIDGDLAVIRFNSENNEYETLEPIDNEDLDSWGLIKSSE